MIGNFDNNIAIRFSQDIFEEMVEASEKFPPFNSDHEGYAVLLEVMDELWDAIKLNQNTPGRGDRIEKECTQVGAMALRLLHDARRRGE